MKMYLFLISDISCNIIKIKNSSFIALFTSNTIIHDYFCTKRPLLMKKIYLLLLPFLLISFLDTRAQSSGVTEVFLITCGPGTETYSIYGHSALRVRVMDENTDLVYNWGVFDFSTPNFVWKFAKGRLDYMLATEPFDRFLQGYFYEQRWVQSQKINLEPDEISYLMGLINENLKPENLKYRYDFFYDDCSTRIRDLLEKTLKDKLTYPMEESRKLPTFREKVGEYQRLYPWLDFGIDLIMGTPGDKKANLRDRMFLPLDMQKGLTGALINRNGRMIPLLQNPETVLEFGPPVVKQHFFTSPIFVFSFVLILIIIFFAIIRNAKITRAADIVIFLIFTLLSFMMIFFNFFTDHIEMKRNLNILWLSPFVIFCLASVILKKDWRIWFRIVFYLCLVSFFIQLAYSHAFNNGFVPLLLILMLRSSARAGFSWNPLSEDSF